MSPRLSAKRGLLAEIPQKRSGGADLNHASASQFIYRLIEAIKRLTAAGASTLTQQPSFTMLSLTFPIPAALSSVYP